MNISWLINAPFLLLRSLAAYRPNSHSSGREELAPSPQDSSEASISLLVEWGATAHCRCSFGEGTAMKTMSRKPNVLVFATHRWNTTITSNTALAENRNTDSSTNTTERYHTTNIWPLSHNNIIAYWCGAVDLREMLIIIRTASVRPGARVTHTLTA